jgi:hypothetical protein
LSREKGKSTQKAFAVLILGLLILGIVLSPVRIPAVSAASQTDINSAIQKGLTFLNRTQATDGHWGDSSPVACTAMAVLSFENAPNSHYGWNLTDPYHTAVQKGLDYLFEQAHIQILSNKTKGNPDTNRNGIGIDFYTYNVGYPHYTDETYQTPMVLLAIVASQNKTQVATTGPANVTGRSYYDISTDIVDWIAWAQNDNSTGAARGGWRYTANFGSSDNSVSQWPVLGLMAAHLWGIDAPAWVRNELNYWIIADQDLTGNPTTNSNYGSFGYTGADNIEGGVLETSTGILELSYVGAVSDNASIVAAEGYINRMWNYYDGNWNVNIGSLYNMYGVMKAMRETIPNATQFIANYSGTPGVEWYNGTGEYADALLANQGSDGQWVNWKNWAEDLPKELSTAFGVLILEFVPVKVLYSLTVHVVNANTNNSISGATVLAAGLETLHGVTDGGKVVFNETQAGTYDVTASNTGYVSASISVSLTVDTEIIIRLAPSAPTPQHPTFELWILGMFALAVITVSALVIILIAYAERIRRRRKKR